MQLSINELSDLTGKDRRTITQRLKDLAYVDGAKGAYLYESAEALEVIYGGGAGGKVFLDDARAQLAIAQKQLAITKDEELRRIRIPIDIALAANDQVLQAIGATLRAAKNKKLTLGLINQLLKKLRDIPAKLKW